MCNAQPWQRPPSCKSRSWRFIQGGMVSTCFFQKNRTIVHSTHLRHQPMGVVFPGVRSPFAGHAKSSAGQVTVRNSSSLVQTAPTKRTKQSAAEGCKVLCSWFFGGERRKKQKRRNDPTKWDLIELCYGQWVLFSHQDNMVRGLCGITA